MSISVKPPYAVWLVAPWSKVAHRLAAAPLAAAPWWRRTICGLRHWDSERDAPIGVTIDPELINRSVVRPCKRCWPERPEWW